MNLKMLSDNFLVLFLISRYLKLIVRRTPLTKASQEIILTKQNKQKTSLCAISLCLIIVVCVHQINILNFSLL